MYKSNIIIMNNSFLLAKIITFHILNLAGCKTFIQVQNSVLLFSKYIILIPHNDPDG